MNFTDEQITRYAQEAEILLAADTKCIQNRVSLALTAGVSEYQLPSTVLGITRITWKGYKLDPYSGKEMIASGSTPGQPTQGQPKFYIYSDRGFRVIKLYPAPSTSLPLVTGNLWTASKIADGFIVQFSSIPDFTSTTERIPSAFRRQFVKDYVLYRCMAREGKAMDLRAATYFKQKFEAGLVQNKTIWSLLHSCIDRTMTADVYRRNFTSRPVLPPQFGEVCD